MIVILMMIHVVDDDDEGMFVFGYDDRCASSPSSSLRLVELHFLDTININNGITRSSSSLS